MSRNSIHPRHQCKCGSEKTVASDLFSGRELCGPCLVDTISDNRGRELGPEVYMMPPEMILLALRSCPEVLPKHGVFSKWSRIRGIIREGER